MFYIIKQIGDGNCFYYSLKYVMKLPLQVIEMRNLLAQEVLNNRPKYSGFIEGAIEDYVNKNILKNYGWADEVEICAAESVWKRPILIYNLDGSLRRKPHDLDDNNSSRNKPDTYFSNTLQPIFLLFSGNDSVDTQTGHYDALIRMS